MSHTRYKGRHSAPEYNPEHNPEHHHDLGRYLRDLSPSDKAHVRQDLDHIDRAGALYNFFIRYDSKLKAHQRDLRTFADKLAYLDHAYRGREITENEFKKEVNYALSALRSRVEGKEGRVLKFFKKREPGSLERTLMEEFKAAAAVILLFVGAGFLGQPSVTGAYIGTSSSQGAFIGVLLMLASLILFLQD